MPLKFQTLQTYFEQVWIKENLDALPSLMSPDARTRGVMGDMPFDQDELCELVTLTRVLYRPLSVSFPVLIEQGDWLSARVEISGLAADTGAPVQVINHIIVRFDGPLMVEIHSSVDTLSFFEQLGLLPESALAIMLGGTRLG